MTLVDDLAHHLAEAHKAGRHDVDAKPYSELDRQSAYDVQLRVMNLLGEAHELEIIECIDHYFVGIEICGTRYVDRTIAGFNGGLADGMSSLGYVMNPRHRDLGAEIADFDVQLEFNGVQIHSAPAKHSFGTVLNSLIAYAKNQLSAYPLKAGTIVTTGSLCGLVPITGTGHVMGKLGSYSVEFDIV